MKKSLRWLATLLVLVWSAALVGDGTAPIIGGTARADEHDKKEEGPSLDALDSAIESSTSIEGGFQLPEGGGGGGGGGGGSLIERLRNRLGTVQLPNPNVNQGGGSADVPVFDSPTAGALESDMPIASVLLQVQAPETFPFNGPPPPPCSPAAVPAAATTSSRVVKGGAALSTKTIGRTVAAPVSVTGKNKAVICVTASTFDRKGKIEIQSAPDSRLQRVSYKAGNPSDAIYVFNVPGPGAYKFHFQAGLGRSVVTESIEVRVEQPDTETAGDSSTGSTGSMGGVIGRLPKAPVELPPNNEPSLSLAALSLTSIQATAIDPDRGQQVCIYPLSAANLTNGSRRCGSGQVSYVYKVSTDVVFNDYPLLAAGKQPRCHKFVLTVFAQDSRGARVSDSETIGLIGKWSIGNVDPYLCQARGGRFRSFIGCMERVESC